MAVRETIEFATRAPTAFRAASVGACIRRNHLPARCALERTRADRSDEQPVASCQMPAKRGSELDGLGRSRLDKAADASQATLEPAAASVLARDPEQPSTGAPPLSVRSCTTATTCRSTSDAIRSRMGTEKTSMWRRPAPESSRQQAVHASTVLVPNRTQWPRHRRGDLRRVSSAARRDIAPVVATPCRGPRPADERHRPTALRSIERRAQPAVIGHERGIHGLAERLLCESARRASVISRPDSAVMTCDEQRGVNATAWPIRSTRPIRCSSRAGSTAVRG